MLYIFCKMPKSLPEFMPKLRKGTQSNQYLKEKHKFQCLHQKHLFKLFYFIAFLIIKLISACGGNYGNNIIK